MEMITVSDSNGDIVESEQEGYFLSFVPYEVRDEDRVPHPDTYVVSGKPEFDENGRCVGVKWAKIKKAKDAI